ncbi:class I SAM-dependent rRNA methyltransferase [Balneatrix alpica]|uniref:Class I SAM-dependent rRNA methyltransferase n=1 Tax=Balneatrix alpica TaxID=75684 RepID=A0ABV5ZH39_9GAMM|nr:class I SAM-dependent rRNA methyltransferase [Balneatrix alpica]
MSLPVLRLLPKADRRLRAGHLWIYSNEVDVAQTPLKGFSAGEQVWVENSAGKGMGVAYVNPNTLICARLISRDAKYPLSKSLLVHRLNLALSLREKAFSKPYYRLVYGEADGLSGLVVDRFGDYLVVQISTAGMELQRQAIVEALVQVVKPMAILFKNDGKFRAVEGLAEYVEDAYGSMPDQVELEENGVRFLAPVREGQKTGWFYDHRLNRARVQHYAPGLKVLDVFSYVGGWGVQAAAAGAASVTCVDASALALQQVAANAQLNGVGERVQTLKGDAFETMKQLINEGERYDMVILDPPAFIQRRKDIANGEQAYQRANQLAMRLLAKDGLLVSASCSMHLQTERLLDMVRATGRATDRHVVLLERGGQGADHPVHAAISETEYLKSLLFRVTPAF